jgi:hypothetical protein
MPRITQKALVTFKPCKPRSKSSACSASPVRFTGKFALRAKEHSCIFRVYMPSITITLSTEAHARLKKLKAPGDSFSDVVLREVPAAPLETCGQLENYFQTHGVPQSDPRLRQAMVSGRKRRSKRRP